jgi:hypothetical protein
MLLAGALLVLLLPGDLPAQEHEEAGQGAAQHGEEHRNKNAVGLFLGASTHLDTDDTGFTVGADYERLIGYPWGAGLIVDFASSNIERDFIVAVPLYFHALHWLRLSAAPGLEVAGHSEEGHEAEVEREFLLRVGAEGEIELATQLGLAAAFKVDWAGDRWTLVYGLGLVVAF